MVDSAIPDFQAEQLLALQKAAQAALWEAGDLRWLLDITQAEIYEFAKAKGTETVFWLVSRQSGKSFSAIVMACELAIRHPHARILYISKSLASCKRITEASMKVIIESAPADCRPEWVESKSSWVFPNGSVIELGGADDEAGPARFRGGAVRAFFVDEVGFMAGLERLMDALQPMTRTLNAQIVLLSTPADTPDHYSEQLIQACEANGTLITRDIYAPGRFTRAEVDAYLAKEARSRNQPLETFLKSSYCLREFFCDRTASDTGSMILGEDWKENRAAICVPWNRPGYWDVYVAMDPGIKDGCGIIFGYYDYLSGRAVVEHELFIKGGSSKVWAEAIQRVLAEHYPDKPIYSFVIDTTANKSICADMWNYHQIEAGPAVNANREGRFNRARVTVAGKGLVISPECKTLIAQCSAALYGKNGDIAHSKVHLHFDLLSSLTYFLDSIDRYRNPYPAHVHPLDLNHAFRHAANDNTELSDVLFAGTNIGRSRRR